MKKYKRISFQIPDLILMPSKKKKINLWENKRKVKNGK